MVSLDNEGTVSWKLTFPKLDYQRNIPLISYQKIPKAQRLNNNSIVSIHWIDLEGDGNIENAKYKQISLLNFLEVRI